MVTKYGPADPGRRVYSGYRLARVLRALGELLRFNLTARLLGACAPAGADRLERRAYEIEGIVKGPLCQVLGAERLFSVLGAEREEEYLLCLPVGALVSGKGVRCFLLACWDPQNEEDEEFHFEVTRLHSLAEEVEVSFFDCATSALMDFYVDRLPCGHGRATEQTRRWWLDPLADYE